MSADDAAGRLLERAIAGEQVLWRGAPDPGSTIRAELGGCGVPAAGIGLLGLVVWLAFVFVGRLASSGAGSSGGTDQVAVGAFAVFAIALVALGPPTLLEWRNLARTRYVVTRSRLLIVEGALLLRAAEVRAFAKAGASPPPLEVRPGSGGSIDLGEVELVELDAGGKPGRREVLPFRLRGLGREGGAALAALAAARATGPGKP